MNQIIDIATVDRIIQSQKNKWGVRIYRYENVGNHIHILLRVTHRKQLKAYKRVLVYFDKNKLEAIGFELGQFIKMSQSVLNSS